MGSGPRTTGLDPNETLSDVNTDPIVYVLHLMETREPYKSSLPILRPGSSRVGRASWTSIPAGAVTIPHLIRGR